MTTLPPLTTDIALLHSPRLVWPKPQIQPAPLARLRRHLPMPEILVLAVAALVIDVAAGWYLHYHLHFWINDEINRTTDAVYVAIGRDPHLGAIGFYWPPLAQLIQIPLVVVLNPFGQTIMAGPVSSACCVALTVPVLAQIARMLGLGRLITLAVCATFALNPVVVYYGANGMSEACFFLGGAVMLWGFLWYVRERTTQSILVFTLGTSAVTMTRLEGPFVALAMSIVATLDLRHLKRSAWDLVVVGTPPFLFLAFWIAVQWILLKDPLFFRHQLGGGAPPAAGHAVWLPNTAAHPLSAVPWALGWVVVLGPALLVLVPATLATPLGPRTRGSLGLLAGMGVFLAIQIDQVIKGTGYGDPRYFVTAILFATVAALWVASHSSNALWKGSVNTCLVALLLLGAGLGSHQLTSPRLTTPEHECVWFEGAVARVIPLLGRPQTAGSACTLPYDGLRPWVSATHWLDARLTSSDRVLTDNSEIPFPDLLTSHSDQYIVQNDDDWHKTTSNPYFVTYIITEADQPGGAPTTAEGDQGALLIAESPGAWKLVGSWKGAYTINHSPTAIEVWHIAGKLPASLNDHQF